jgi:hypothetical protein
MEYPIEMQEDGWRLKDPVRNATAEYGGVPLEHLTLEEAHVMLKLLQHRDHALIREANEPDWLLARPRGTLDRASVLRSGSWRAHGKLDGH